jgi:hypothetical protein
MKSLASIGLLGLLLAACGDDLKAPGPLVYTDPSGGLLKLVKDPASTGTRMVLDLVVGDQALTGYATGFDLPVAPGVVTLGPFTPGTALNPGSAPAAAGAALADKGPLASTLVVALSQKAQGTGAVTTDAQLAPGTVLLKVELDVVPGAPLGVVFDGTAAGFHLPSGGLRNKAGMTVVDETKVSIGKLEIAQ